MNQKRLALFDGEELEADPSEGRRRAPDAFLLIRFGVNEYTKDGQRGEFEFTEEDADAVIADFAVRGKDLVIDYDHASLRGAPAPAAGWIGSLSKTAEGVLATMNYWTEQAEAYLESGEYRYYSPVLRFSRSGRRVSGIHSVALTNHPALHNLPALVADDVAGDEGLDDDNHDINPSTKENDMRQIIELLGLSDVPEDERPAALSAKVGALAAMAGQVGDFLQLHDAKSLEEVTLRLQSLVPAAEKSRLEAELRSRDANDAVRLALSEGKITEAKKDWALRFAERDLQAFNELMQDAPRLVPDNQGLSERPAPAATALFGGEAAEVLSMIGLSDDDIKKLEVK